MLESKMNQQDDTGDSDSVNSENHNNGVDHSPDEDDNQQNLSTGRFVKPVEQNDDLVEGSSTTEKPKTRKKGIIYISNLPKHMNVVRIREILGQYGEIGRVFLQPEKIPVKQADSGKKKKKRKLRHFTEGWIEFERKRVAKQLALMLNNKQISMRKRSQFYDHLWTMKYLPRFKWLHLSERLNYERAVHKQRLMTEVSQARKEANFFQSNLDKSEHLKKKNRSNKNKNT